MLFIDVLNLFELNEMISIFNKKNEAITVPMSVKYIVDKQYTLNGIDYSTNNVLKILNPKQDFFTLNKGIKIHFSNKFHIIKLDI